MKLLSLAVTFFLMAACAAQVPKVLPTSGEPPAPLNPPPVATPGPAPVVAGGRVFDESILQGREFLLETPSSSGILLRDPVLGDLGNDAQIFRTVDQFFHQTAAGKLDPALLVPRWATYLAAWAKRAKTAGLIEVTVRVGHAIQDPQGGRTVPVRILAGEKEFHGWVFLVGDEKDLLVSDVQIEAATPPPPFDPESDSQEISSPSRR